MRKSVTAAGFLERDCIIKFSRIEHTHASRTKEAKSAPENPSSLLNSLTSLINSFTVSGSVLQVEEKNWNFPYQCLQNVLALALIGKGTYNSLSNLPGRNMAGSIISGLFVAAITNVCFLDSIPSISVSNWLTTRTNDISTPSPPHASSWVPKNQAHQRRERRAALARANKDLTARSDSPTYLFKSSGPLMDMKLAFASFATA